MTQTLFVQLLQQVKTHSSLSADSHCIHVDLKLCITSNNAVKTCRHFRQLKAHIKQRHTAATLASPLQQAPAAATTSSSASSPSCASGSARVHACDECPQQQAQRQVFRTAQALHAHLLKVHGKGRLFSCADCDFKSPRKKDMQGRCDDWVVRR